MPINKILHVTNFKVKSIPCDLLFPLPANDDVCFRKVGIIDFQDSDDEWDSSFIDILKRAVNGNEYKMMLKDTVNNKSYILKNESVVDVIDILSEIDSMSLQIEIDSGKSIHFTHGHMILWLFGFTANEINVLSDKIVSSDKMILATLY